MPSSRAGRCATWSPQGSSSERRDPQDRSDADRVGDLAVVDELHGVGKWQLADLEVLRFLELGLALRQPFVRPVSSLSSRFAASSGGSSSGAPPIGSSQEYAFSV